MKWIARGVALVVAAYAALFTVVLVAMSQPPKRFGQFMKHAPQALIWAALPGQRMWLWARSGSLQEGDAAPDFTLSTYDHQSRVVLASHRGQRPVVLVFGSYT
jgi:hypothetical protein